MARLSPVTSSGTSPLNRKFVYSQSDAAKSVSLCRLRCPAMGSLVQVASLRRVVGYNVLATSGAVLVVVFVVCALFAPWIAPQDPAHIDLPNRLIGPSSAHWFGTDELGRDVLSRVIY